jgi:hypothetical protein
MSRNKTRAEWDERVAAALERYPAARNGDWVHDLDLDQLALIVRDMANRAVAEHRRQARAAATTVEARAAESARPGPNGTRFPLPEDAATEARRLIRRLMDGR